MKFFSGFCVSGESELFVDFLPKKEAFICGFSFGAINAFEHALTTKEFFKKLILLSPAFYCQTDDKFKEQQLAAFKADEELYKIKLLKKSGLDEESGKKYGVNGSAEQLEKLLYFGWDKSGFEKLSKMGVKIEVYIGSNDRVVDPNRSVEFFKEHATVYLLKDKNHFLA